MDENEQSNLSHQEPEKKTIQHIVLSGGAHLGLYTLGSLKYLSQNEFFSIDNIQTIRGTSMGGLIGAILTLKIDWDILSEYVIKRPWYKMIHLTPTMFLDVLQNKGLLGRSFFENVMRPLLQSKDLDVSISLQELYEYSGIELYMYSVCLDTYTLIELSHKTYPSMMLIDAIYMTCCLPYVFQPVWFEDSYYVDGGLINNYPLEFCLEDLERKLEDEITTKIDTDTILGINFVNNGEKMNKLSQDANIFEYGYFLYKNMVNSLRKQSIKPDIYHELVIPYNDIDMKDGYEVLLNEEKRQQYIQQGEKYAQIFMSFLYKEKNV